MNWCVFGINFKNANIRKRQRYALNNKQIKEIYGILRKNQIANALIISTCNRTEFFIPELDLAKFKLLVKSAIYPHEFQMDLFHVKEGIDAIKYFYRICTGLESQVPGDFEILGQVRKSCMLAKKEGMLNGVWEKTINNGLRAGKNARSETDFYSGAGSVSYACIEYIKSINLDLNKIKILLIGTGSIGTRTLEHLVKIVSTEKITITNRSYDRSKELAQKYIIQGLRFEEFPKRIPEFDVIICATQSTEFVIKKSMVRTKKYQYYIDLSVPLNIDPEITDSNFYTLANTDDLSVIINQNLKKRMSEISKVESIVEESLEELKAWFTIKEGLPVLTELKEELSTLKNEALVKFNSNEHTKNSAFLDEYIDELFMQISNDWISKVRAKSKH